eukprot:COSAG02_NODE_1550_length_11965_cov_326.834401_3_plen_986_part_00
MGDAEHSGTQPWHEIIFDDDALASLPFTHFEGTERPFDVDSAAPAKPLTSPPASPLCTATAVAVADAAATEGSNAAGGMAAGPPSPTAQDDSGENRKRSRQEAPHAQPAQRRRAAEGSSSASAANGEQSEAAAAPSHRNQRRKWAWERGLALLVAVADGDEELRAGGEVVRDREAWIKWDPDGRAILVSTADGRHDRVAEYLIEETGSTSKGGEGAWDRAVKDSWVRKGLGDSNYKDLCTSKKIEGVPWMRLELEEPLLGHCRALHRLEASSPAAVRQSIHVVCDAVRKKLEKISKDVPYCKVLLLLKEEDFLAVAEKELEDAQILGAPAGELEDVFAGYQDKAKKLFLTKVVREYEKKWRASLLMAAQSHRNFSREAIHKDLQATSEDYRKATEPNTQELMEEGLRAKMLNCHGFDDRVLEATFRGKFLEAGCVILHMDHHSSKLDPQQLVAVVRCHSSLFPWLAAVAVRNSANAICGVHVLKNITQDKHSDFVRRHIGQPLAICNSSMLKVKRRKYDSFGTLVDCAVQKLDGMRSVDSGQVSQEADRECQQSIVDVLRRGHPHVAQYYFHEETQGKLGFDCYCVYTEWCDVSIFSWMVDCAPDFHERVQVCRSICEAVNFLHSDDVAHLAIEPDSIMFRGLKDGRMEPVLTSFGSACKSEHMTNGDVIALGELIVGIFVDHVRHPVDGWTIRYRGRKDEIEPVLCEMERYQAEELCDMLSFIQRVSSNEAHHLDEKQQGLSLVTVTFLLQHPVLKWPGHNGLNQRVQWMDINKGDSGLPQLEPFRDWRSHSDLTFLPCSQPRTHATSGHGLIECICHCAKFPDKARFGLPDTNETDTAEENDAAARFFLRLFPTLFVVLFRDLADQVDPTEVDMTKLWEVSSVPQRASTCPVLPDAPPSAEGDHIHTMVYSSAARETNPSRPDAEGDIFEDGDPQVIPTKAAGDDSSASGVDPTSGHEAEQARQQDRAKHRRLATEAPPHCSV